MSGPYTMKEAGKVTEVGTQVYEAVFEGWAAADTPIGRCADCAVIVTTAWRAAEDGLRKGYTLREWHARGVGPVKVVGEITWETPGRPKRTFRIDASLSAATIGGQAVSALDR